jgi:hypothetical protein
MVAARTGATAAAAELIQRCPHLQVNAQDKDGNSAVMLACSQVCCDVMALEDCARFFCDVLEVNSSTTVS